MGEQARVLRVVLVSPGDVPGERKASQTVVDELNRTVAPKHGCRLSLWRWETDARPGLHLEGPQGLIDEEMKIEDADVVVGVFWKRFGTPTHDADSGTEHELRRAWAAWKQHGQPDVMVYFCGRAYSAKTRDETTQWGRVPDFQEALPEQQLWWRYKTVREFEGLLREHLTRFVLSRVKEPEVDLVSVVGTRVLFNLPALAAAFQGRGASSPRSTPHSASPTWPWSRRRSRASAVSARASSPRATPNSTPANTTSWRGSAPRTAAPATSPSSPQSSARRSTGSRLASRRNSRSTG
jgi:hypothetical protein